MHVFSFATDLSFLGECMLFNRIASPYIPNHRFKDRHLIQMLQVIMGGTDHFMVSGDSPIYLSYIFLFCLCFVAV